MYFNNISAFLCEKLLMVKIQINAFCLNVEEQIINVLPKKERSLFAGAPLNTKTQLCTPSTLLMRMLHQ